MKHIIGIDAGTTNVKAVLFDEENNEVAVAYRENAPVQPADRMMEMDMNLLWKLTLECLVEVVGKTKVDPKNIVGIAVTGQGEGLWMIDDKGEPVCNARLWNDGRTADIIQELVNKNLFQEIYNTTGTAMFTGSNLIQLLWAERYTPELLAKARYILFCKDWIRYKLTGKINIEYSDTATSMLDIRSLDFPRPLLEKLGLAKYVKLYPPLLRAMDIAGTITKEVARATGLQPDTPVGVGAIDVVAAAVGVGAINDGDTSTTIGTTCATSIVTNHINPGVGTTRYEVHGREGYYINLQPTMSGSPNIDWVIQEIAQVKDFVRIDQIIERLNPVAGGIIYHPYIAKSGERAPFYNPNARASFFGISSGIKNEYLVKAVYEGVAFSIKDCLESMGTNTDGTIYLAGGGAKSHAWAQIISDCTGHPVEISAGKELAAKGAANMLGIALGIYKDYEDMKQKTCRSLASFKPNKERQKIYDAYYVLYRKMREGFNEYWDLRKQIRDKILADSL